MNINTATEVAYKNGFEAGYISGHRKGFAEGYSAGYENFKLKIYKAFNQFIKINFKKE